MLNDKRRIRQSDYGFERKRGYSTAAALKAILNELNEQDWVEASAVIRRDGIMLASNISASLDTKNACAIMSATIAGAAKNITKKFKRGFPKRVLIQTKKGDIIISEAGSKAILVCLVTVSYDPALMSDDIEKITQKIDDLL